MNISENLSKIRSEWVNRVADNMESGVGVREHLLAKLENIFDLLCQAIQTGDLGWIDPIINDCSNAPFKSDLLESEKNTTIVLSQMMTHMFELARENFGDKVTLDLIDVVFPIFTHAVDIAAHVEMETRITNISNALVDVQSKLGKLDRSKSNFISVAAHELKTPLTLIEGYTSMLKDLVEENQNNSGQVELIFGGVNNGIDRLRTIINDMIDVSLIDNNLLSLHFQPTWINQVLTLILSEFKKSCDVRNIRIDLQTFPEGNEMFFADAERLYQAFRNILSNAIKFTPDGGQVTINGRSLPGFFEVVIQDTGIGISVQEQEVIFEKFSHVGNTMLHSSGKTKFKGGGPGLGLPIARGIIEAHGGTIWVESEGHDEYTCPGSTFHILLPIRKESPDPRISELFGTDFN